jgi:hypothetical protein
MPRSSKWPLVVTACVAVLANLAMLSQLPSQNGWLLAACVVATLASGGAVGMSLLQGGRDNSISPAPSEATSDESANAPSEEEVQCPGSLPENKLCSRVIEPEQNIEPTGNPLENKPWSRLVEDCVCLFDEVERLRPELDNTAQEFASHVTCRLQEILERSGVEIIAEDTGFDRTRHQAETSLSAIDNETTITRTLSPGFAVGRRVFRRARVELAESVPNEKGTTS